MKMLIVFPRFGIGGIAKVSSFLANAFDECGYDVVCVSMSDDINILNFNNGIRLVYLPYEKQGKKINIIDKFTFFCKFVLFLQREKFDWVIALGTDLTRICAMAKGNLKFSLIGSERGNPYLYSEKEREKYVKALLQCKKVVFQTENAKIFYPKFIQDKSVVIPNPCYLKEGIRFIKSDLSKKIILVVSRISKEKNIMGIVKAFSLVKHKLPGYELYVFGDGEERDNIVEFVEKEEIDRVKFFGRIRNPFEICCDASLYVLNSDSEGMPNSLIEAMMYGIPSIATDCPPGGVQFLSDGGRRVCLVPVRDEKALSMAMVKVLTDHKYRDSLILNSQEILHLLDPKSIIDKWVNLVHE